MIFLTAQGEQVSETLGKDWIFRTSRRADRVDYTGPWEAVVLPLHHSREKLEPSAVLSLFGGFEHCNSTYSIAMKCIQFQDEMVTDHQPHVIRQWYAQET